MENYKKFLEKETFKEILNDILDGFKKHEIKVDENYEKIIDEKIKDEKHKEILKKHFKAVYDLKDDNKEDIKEELKKYDLNRIKYFLDNYENLNLDEFKEMINNFYTKEKINYYIKFYKYKIFLYEQDIKSLNKIIRKIKKSNQNNEEKKKKIEIWNKTYYRNINNKPYHPKDLIIYCKDKIKLFKELKKFL